MKKIASFLIILSFCILLSTAFFYENAEASVAMPEINADSVCIMTADTGRVLYAKNIDTKFYPSSLIKLMTAIVAMQNADLESNLSPKETELVTVGTELSVLNEGYKSTDLRVGDVVSVAELVNRMVILDADDAAVVLATYIGRKKLGGFTDYRYGYDKDGLDNFVDMMNHEANIIGLENTHFSSPVGDPNGQYSYSSAEDMAKIAGVFLQNKYLADICTQIEYNGAFSNNLFINQESEYYDGRISGIISNISDKGSYITVKALCNDIEVIISMLNFKAETVFENEKLNVIPYEYDYNTDYGEVSSLLDYIYGNFVMYRYISKGQRIGEITVEGAMDPSNETLVIVAGESSEYLVNVDMLDLFGYTMSIGGMYYKPTVENLYKKYLALQATITKGTVLGTLDLYYNGTYYDSVYLYAANTVEAYEQIPLKREKAWYELLPWQTYLFWAVIASVSIFSFVQIIGIRNNLKMRRNKKRLYAATRSENKAALHYTKKRK